MLNEPLLKREPAKNPADEAFEEYNEKLINNRYLEYFLWSVMILSLMGSVAFMTCCIVPNEDYDEPRLIDRTLNVSDAAISWRHACAVDRKEGKVWCWGSNDRGELGDGTYVSSVHPVRVSSNLRNVVQIVAGGEHTCALTGTGDVWCWGAGLFGQLGTGNRLDESRPKKVKFSCKKFEFVLEKTSLRNGTIVWNKTSKVRRACPKIKKITAGDFHTCSLDVEGTIRCWGDNSKQQMWSHSNRYVVPKQIFSWNDKYVDLTSGSTHNCALEEDGSLWCWGNGEYGRLGTVLNSNEKYGLSYVYSSYRMNIVKIVAGREHTCVLTKKGKISCFGNNVDGQLGDGTFVSRADPKEVSVLGEEEIDDLVSGGHHLFAIGKNKMRKIVWGWGSNDFGQLGDGTSETNAIPIPLDHFKEASKLIAGGMSTCAIWSNGTMDCCGVNDDGQLGDGTKIMRMTTTFN